MKDSLSTVSYQDYKNVIPMVVATSSSDDKADLIRTNLTQFTIALQVLSRYPEAMNEFKTALSRANGSTPEEACKDR